MSAPMNFVGKERKEPTVFITESGFYRLKIVNHEVDGYTNEGNEKHKYSFECNRIITENGKPALSKEVYSLSSTYNGDEKQEWVFMNLADALKISTAFDPASLVGYYVMGEVEMKAGFKDPSKLYANLSPYGYKYSRANDELPPVPEFKEQAAESYTPVEVVEDISEDELPF